MLIDHAARVMRFGMAVVAVLLAVTFAVAESAAGCAARAGGPSFIVATAAEAAASVAQAADVANAAASDMFAGRVAAAPHQSKAASCCAPGSFDGSESACANAMCATCLATFGAAAAAIAVPLRALDRIARVYPHPAARDLIPALPPPRLA
jgi:hypothetical protein